MSSTPEATAFRKELRVALGAEASNVSGKATRNWMVACRASPATCQHNRHNCNSMTKIQRHSHR